MFRYARPIFPLLLLLAAHAAAALSYSAQPFSGRVVDADTKQPLEGVIVVASWQLQGRLGRGVGVLYSTESVTDHDGRFSMPAWGPLEVTAHADGESLPARMSPNEPALFLFKPGYEPGQENGMPYYDSSYLNDAFSTGDSVRTVANDRILELHRWTQSEAMYNRRLMLWDWSFLNGCGWARAPRMTVALIREGERLKYLTGRNEVYDPRYLNEDYKGQHCGSKNAILDKALK